MALANSALAKRKRRQPKTGQRLTSIVKKSTQASGARKSLRLQSKSPVSPTPQIWPAQPSPTPLAPISQTACTKRKRSRDSEAETDEPKEGRPQNNPEEVLLSVSSPLRRSCQKTPKLEPKPTGQKVSQNSPKNPRCSLRRIHNHYNHSTRT